MQARVLALLAPLALSIVPLAACGTSDAAPASRPGTTAHARAEATPSREAEPEHPERFSDAPASERVSLDADAWRARLSDDEFHVLRERGTERAFSGTFHDHHEDGIYRCAGCGAPLFDAAHKFESGTGWPSFDRAIEPGRVAREVDRSYGMLRTEVHCARCGGHLGHLFPDGPRETTGDRFCINSISLDFDAREAERGDGERAD